MSINNKNAARVDLRNRIEIAEGNKTQQDAKFSPSIIGTVDGASQVKHADNFHRPADPSGKVAVMCYKLSDFFLIHSYS